jgi:hypothetical protein
MEHREADLYRVARAVFEATWKDAVARAGRT